MARVPYASVVSSLMYAMMCTRLYIYYAIGLVSWFQLELDLEYINTSEGKLTLCFIIRNLDLCLAGYKDVAWGCVDQDEHKLIPGHAFLLIDDIIS